jgi:hypothetical protein
MRTRIGRGRGSRSDRQGRNLQFASTRARHHMLAMTRIAITAAAFDAIAATLPLGSVSYENAFNERGERYVWLPPHVVDRLRAQRRPGESYSDVILRIAASAG